MRFFAIFLIILLQGCMTAREHREAVQDDSGDKVTVGSVQQEIKVGMSGAEVIVILGSPNIVSTDEERREVWIYDKFSNNVTFSTSSFSFFESKGRGSQSKNQKTLTIIINFDKEKRVRDFAYHTSRF